MKFKQAQKFLQKLADLIQHQWGLYIKNFWLNIIFQHQFIRKN